MQHTGYGLYRALVFLCMVEYFISSKFNDSIDVMLNPLIINLKGIPPDCRYVGRSINM
jgi:hypothetical protein